MAAARRSARRGQAGETMSCLMQAWHGAGLSWHGLSLFLICSYDWARHDNIYPYLGGYISAAVIFLTFVATYRSARSIKMSDNFIAFTQAFNAFMKERHELTELPTQRPANLAPGQTFLDEDQRKARAKDYFGRFYGVIFAEYYAYRQGTLHRRILTLWMKSRWREFNPDGGTQEVLQQVNFTDGWDHWHENFHRGAEDSFTRLMRRIQECPEPYVSSAVRWYGPWSQWFRWFFFVWIALASHLLQIITAAVAALRAPARDAIRRWGAAVRNGAGRFRRWLSEVAWVSFRRGFTALRRSVSNGIRAAWNAVSLPIKLGLLIVIAVAVIAFLIVRHFH